MTSGLNTRPTDEELAMLWPNNLHTRWGQEGFMVVLRGGLTTLGVPFIDGHDHQS